MFFRLAKASKASKVFKYFSSNTLKKAYSSLTSQFFTREGVFSFGKKNLLLGLNTYVLTLSCAYRSYFVDKERTSYIKMRKQNTCWCYETETCTYLTVLIKMVGSSSADG